MILSFDGRSDTGKVRQRNEDCVRVEPDLGLFIVADGMGGYAGGDVASSIACDVIANHVRAGWDRVEQFISASTGSSLVPYECLRSRQQVMELLGDAICAADVEIQRVAAVDAAAGSDALTGMGSTVVLAMVAGSRLFVAHVGDSRAYLLRRHAAVRLTADHSLLQGLVDGGMISSADVARFPMKNVLTRALGVPGVVIPDLLDVDLRDGDRVVLCSDGLHGLVRDDFIVKLGENGEPARCTSKLVAYANAAGGNDNVSVVIVQASDPDVQAAAAAAGVEPGWDGPDPRQSPCVCDAIREHSLFRGLTLSEWLRLYSSMPRQVHEDGATIFSAGDLSDGMYCVLYGTVDVLRDGYVVKSFQAGTCLGEMCLVDEKVRLATAVARGPTVVMFFSRHEFMALCERQPGTASRLLWQLQSRTAGWLRDCRDELNIMKAFVAGMHYESPESREP